MVVMKSITRKQVIYTILAIVIFFIIMASSLWNKKTPLPVNTALTAEEQLKQQEELLRQDALLGSIATSTDGKEMVYTNKKYKLTFQYRSDWLKSDSGSFGSGQIQLFNNNYKIETAIIPTNQVDNNLEAIRFATTTILINNNKVLRTDILAHADGGINVANNPWYNIRSYKMPLYSDPTQSLVITMFNLGTSTSNFGAVDDIVKSVEWLQN
jgi:hypothetical protein